MKRIGRVLMVTLFLTQIIEAMMHFIPTKILMAKENLIEGLIMKVIFVVLLIQDVKFSHEGGYDAIFSA